MYKKISKILSLVILACGLSVIIGWFLDIPALKSISPNFVTMKFNTALCFALIGTAVFFSNSKSKVSKVVFNFSASAVFVIGIISVIEYIFQTKSGIDQIFVRESADAILTSNPGRMAFNTAINFSLIGLSFYLIQSRKKILLFSGQVFILFQGLAALLSFLGYLYDAEPLIFGLSYSTAMAFHTAVLFIFCSVAILFANPEIGIMYTFSGSTVGSKMLRSILPVAILIPVFLGWLKVQAEIHKIAHPRIGVAFVALGNLAITSVFIYIFAYLANKKDEILRESEERYKAISEYSGNAICIVNQEAKITWCNNQMVAMGGYSKEQIYAAKSFAEFMAPESIEFVTNNFIKAVKNESYVHNYTFYFVRADGKKRLAEKQMVDYKDKNGNFNLLISMVDITDRKNMEEELIKARKLDSLGILAGGIAHDFNNILTGILGNISTARHEVAIPDKAAEILNEAEKAAFQAKNLTQQLLTFSKGGAPVKKVTNLSNIISEAALFAARGTKSKCIFNIDTSISLVQIDPGQISQVISNIVINAVQSMPDGGEINITAENSNLTEHANVHLRAGSYVRIIIKDRGCGIPANYLEKIFDPYFTTKQTGSGLGLATSYSIVKNHDGYIFVESETGKGSTFTIYLPAYTGRADISVLTHDKKIVKGAGRILVMDDEDMICMVITRILTKLGYSVECVKDSDQAASKYSEKINTPEAFDAVILDLTIPGGKGGKEAIEVLKKIDPYIKAVVSSGYSSDPIISKYKEFGFSGVLPKPFTMEEVSNVIAGVLTAGSK